MTSCKVRCQALLIAMMLLTSCASTMPPGEQPADVPFVVENPQLSRYLPPLPRDREASRARTFEYNGATTFDRSLNAIDNDTALDLVSAANTLSWGMWEFNPWLDELTSIEVVMTIPDGDEAYIALADYQNNTWEFDGPLTAGQALELDDVRHRSSAGNMYLTVLTHGGNLATVHKLVLTTEDGWVIVTVDSEGYVGTYTSLAVVAGMPAISYFADDPDHDLKYAESSTTTGASAQDWSVSTVDSAGELGGSSSLAVVAGQPAISYFDQTGLALKYVRRDYQPLKVWVKVIVHDSADGRIIAGHCSLAVVDGYPMITHTEIIDNDLWHAVSFTATGASAEDWHTNITDSEGSVGSFNSLEVVDGKAAVAYRSYSDGNLKYKWFPNPAKVVVHSVVDTLTYISLAVVDGRPAIGWCDSGNEGLRYSYSSTARGTSSADWNTVYFSNIDEICSHSSLAVIDGRPAISFAAYTPSPYGQRLMFAWSSTPAGADLSDWGIMAVDDTSIATGEYTSLAEVDGKPAISYFDHTNGDLMYAIRLGP